VREQVLPVHLQQPVRVVADRLSWSVLGVELGEERRKRARGRRSITLLACDGLLEVGSQAAADRAVSDPAKRAAGLLQIGPYDCKTHVRRPHGRGYGQALHSEEKGVRQLALGIGLSAARLFGWYGSESPDTRQVRAAHSEPALDAARCYAVEAYRCPLRQEDRIHIPDKSGFVVNKHQPSLRGDRPERHMIGYIASAWTKGPGEGQCHVPCSPWCREVKLDDGDPAATRCGVEDAIVVHEVLRAVLHTRDLQDDLIENTAG